MPAPCSVPMFAMVNRRNEYNDGARRPSLALFDVSESSTRGRDPFEYEADPFAPICVDPTPMPRARGMMYEEQGYYPSHFSPGPTMDHHRMLNEVSESSARSVPSLAYSTCSSHDGGIYMSAEPTYSREPTMSYYNQERAHTMSRSLMGRMPPVDRIPMEPQQLHMPARMEMNHGMISIPQQQQQQLQQDTFFADMPPMGEVYPVKKNDEVDDQNRFKPFHEEKWSVRYKELIEFHKEHGHAAVPHSYPKNPQLARWVKRQRRQYKLRCDNRPSTMTAERQDLLDQLGFIWDSHEVNWHEKLEGLKEYRKEFGNCNVPSNSHDKKLATWVKCQRRQYKLYWDGKNSAMTPNRILELEKIGFEWEIRASTRSSPPSMPSGQGIPSRVSVPMGQMGHMGPMGPVSDGDYNLMYPGFSDL